MKKQILIAFSLLSAACSPMVDNKGYVKQAEIRDKVVVGQTSKDEVLDQFGSPSSQSTFGSETWYYIHNRKETVGFLKPEVVDQDITRVEFDSAGLVSKVERYNQDNAQEVATVKRITPTEGHSVGMIEQMLGNIGRFNKPASSAGTVAPGRRPNPGGF